MAAWRAIAACWQQTHTLAQAYRTLNNAAEQQKAFAEYQRVRQQKLQTDRGVNFSRTEATKQKLETEPPSKK